MVGGTIAHYTILEKVGEGGMGTIYRARDAHLDRFVAIKILRADRVADPERKRRFVQEAKAASALNHPNIVTVHDVDQRDGVDYIVMEHVAGKPLDELIPRKGMGLTEALKLAVQIADALAAAHAAGIVHRDLKPSNVLVSDNGHVKVVDFGLATLTEAVPRRNQEKSTTSLTDENTIVGSVHYMSPEQAQGMKVDPRSDIFSFGSVLYEMVSGRRAFQSNSTMSTLGAVIHNEPPALGAEVPHDLQKIVTRCLHKDPARRIQTTADLKAALDDLKEESESGRLTAVHPAPRRLRRSLVWAVALSALLLIAAIVYWPVDRSPQQLQAVPLTTYPGIECCASFSPDGNQIAFTWNGQKQDNFDIYIQAIGSGKPLRRTTDPARDRSPAWSPDGRFIAFRRQRAENVQMIVLMPALSGSETVLAEAISPWSDATSSLAWTPDSRWVVYSSQDSLVGSYTLYMVSPDTREKRGLTQPMTKTIGDFWPAFRPDGHALVFVRSPAPYISDLYLLKLSGDFLPQGDTERLTFVNSLVRSPKWIADGREVIYSLGLSSGSGLWRVAAQGSPSGGRPANAERLALPGRSVDFPAVSSVKRRLVYTAGGADENIWRIDITAPNSPPFSRRLINSTFSDRNPQFSPDGKRIAFVSTRSGTSEIWLCDQDGSGEEKLTSMEAPMTGSPRWSPDGEWVVYDSNAQRQFDVYIVSAKGGRPRRLTTESGGGAVASWSRDGKRIYFVSNRTGRSQIWRSTDGGNAVQVTKDGGHVAFESKDGKSLYYTMTNIGVSTLFKVAVEGGPETKVIDAIQGASFAVAEKGIYFIPPADISGRASILFFEFSTGRTQRVAVIENPSASSTLSVSPDGRSFLYTRVDEENSDLMLVENFR